MWLILCVALLPCLWAAEIKGIRCPDGKECPLGKTCCPISNGFFQCCDLPDEDRLNKKLQPGPMSSSTFNVSRLSSCNTLCADGECCEFYNAECCDNVCCESDAQCCGSGYSEWCCHRRDRCHSDYGYCTSGASTLSPVIATLLLMVLLISSKFFF